MRNLSLLPFNHLVTATRERSLIPMAEDLLPLGSFVKVDRSVGVIVGLPETGDVPSDHYAVWFGELNQEKNPKCKTVPIEFCLLVVDVEHYH